MSWENAGHAWGAQAWDWALYQEPLADNLYDAVLTALGVQAGVTLLDIACGSGLAVQRAVGRGARCTGVDASAGLLDIAAQRAPSATWVRAGMDDIPLASASFDLVASFNGLQFGGPPAAVEAARLLRPGGRIGVGFWEDAGDYAPLFSAVAALSPPPAPGAPSPMGFARPGTAEAFLAAAGLRTVERSVVHCVGLYRSADEARRGFAASGAAHVATAHSGEAAVHEALADLVPRHADPVTGVVRLTGVMAYVIATTG
jgi:ubiquinone/menaquinone biosynthesis C-methylase UbiE